MHGDTLDIGSTRSGCRMGRGIGHRRRPGPSARLGDGLRGVDRGARWRVGLVRVVHLDDLNGLKIRRCLPREAHEQDSAKSEVGGHDDPDTRMFGKGIAETFQSGVIEPGGAHHGMDALRDAKLQRGHHGSRCGEVDGHLDLCFHQSGQRIMHIDGSGQVQVVGLVNSLTHLGTHAASRADHTHPQHPATLPSGAFVVRGCAAAIMMVGMSYTRSLLALAAAVACSAALVTSPPVTAAEGTESIASVDVTAIPGSRIFTGALQDLDTLGYRESEYLLTLSDPQVYSYTGETTEVTTSAAPTSPQGQYRSRMIVRLPEDPADFNGRVLVEMMNTTTLVDLDVAWEQAHEYLAREGWGYVGLTVQQTGINALANFTRERSRYQNLGLNLVTPAAAADAGNAARDPSLAWDLTSAVGSYVESADPRGPFAGYDITSTYLTGQSQMAGYAVTYINAVHPLHQVYDGFLVSYRGTRATNLQYVAPESGTIPTTSSSESQRRIDGGGTPVINLQSESDPLGPPVADDPAVWRDDADTVDDKFRLWEVAGSAHNDRWGSEQALGILDRDYGLTFVPACDWTPPTGINAFPMRFAWHSALDSLARWVEEGQAPAIADRIERQGGVIVRDKRGNARGGLRLSPIEVPVATRGPVSTGGLFCPLTGFQSPYGRGLLKRLYPSKRDYVTDVRSAAWADVRAGYLLGPDAGELVRMARRGPVKDGQTIQSY